MQQTAQIIAEFSNDPAVQAELHNLIAQNIYTDDYIKFKDLFHPESNSRLKSTMVSKFAQDFRNVVKSGNYPHLKSNDTTGLEQYLIKNNLSLYVPFPLTDYSENQRTPTVCFQPLDNDTLTTGYVSSSLKSTKSVPDLTSVPVDNDYTYQHPIYIVEPTPVLDSLKKINSGGGTGTPANYVHQVKIGDLFITSHYGVHLFGGPIIIKILRVAPARMADGDIKAIIPNDELTVYVKRQYIRQAKKGHMHGWFHVNTLWDSNWSSEKKMQSIIIFKEDHSASTTISASATYSAKGISTTVSTTYSAETISYHVIAIQEWDRNWFFATNKIGDGNYFRGSQFRNGWPIRAISPQFWMTTPSRTFN